MAFSRGPKIVTDGLVLMLDAANIKSYPTTGTTWYDKSGNGNNGVLVNGTTFDSANGGSIVFDGVDDYDLVSSNGFGVFNNQSFTVDMTINPNTVSGDHPFFSYDFTTHAEPFYSIQIRQYSIGSIFFSWNNGTTYRYISIPTNTLVAGNWYNLTIIYSSGRQEIWVNGVLSVSTAFTDVITFYNQPVWIGKANYASKYYGKIGSCKYYNRALTTEEIQQNYNATKSRYNL